MTTTKIRAYAQFYGDKPHCIEERIDPAEWEAWREKHEQAGAVRVWRFPKG